MGCSQICNVCLNFNVIYVTIFLPSHQNMKHMIEGLVKVSTGRKYGLILWCKSSLYLVKEFPVHSHIYHKKCDCNIFDVIYVTMHRDHANKQNNKLMSWYDTPQSRQNTHKLGLILDNENLIMWQVIGQNVIYITVIYVTTHFPIQPEV